MQIRLLKRILGPVRTSILFAFVFNYREGRIETDNIDYKYIGQYE